MFKIYEEERLAAILEVERRFFHRKIKPQIIKDFKSELKMKNIEYTSPNI
jgi:hypothetical protein